jgi:hypothetical protein
MLSGLAVSIFLAAWNFAYDHPRVIATGSFAIATLNLLFFATSPEYREIFVASTGGPDAAARVLAADLTFVGASARSALASVNASIEAKNVVTLTYQGGDLVDFWYKAKRLQNVAREKTLTVVTNTATIRDAGAQAWYRTAAMERYVRVLMRSGMSRADAVATATTRFQTLHVDHLIDLQVAGQIANPNAIANLGLIDSTVNTSVGAQLQSQIATLGLVEGDVIYDVVISAPSLP